MPLTHEEKSAIIAAVTAAVDGTPTVAAPAVPWYRDTTSPVPTAPLADVSNVDEIKRYAAHGFKTNLKRGVAVSDWAASLAVCDAIVAAQTPDAANAIMAGAGYFAPDVAVLLILGGGTQGGMFQPKSIFAPWGSGFDIVAAAAWLVALPGEAGPGLG